jgi:microcystin-dependent protein
MDFFIGMIVPMGINFAPIDWLSCEGQTLAISQYTALYSLLGTRFGGNGTSTFQLPDLRGRLIVGQGHNAATNITYTIGQAGGVNSVALTAANLPSHTHTSVNLSANSQDNSQSTPGGNILGGGTVNQYSQNAANTTLGANAASASVVGGATPLQTQSPFVAMYHNICINGLYPARPN